MVSQSFADVHSPDIDLYFFRHGQTRGNIVRPPLIVGRSNEIPLSDKGEEQARKLGQFLLSRDIAPTRIYSSPALRAVETAGLALSEMGLAHATINIDDDLQEMDQGQWVGLYSGVFETESVAAEIERLGKDFKAPGGESMNEVGLRKWDWIQNEFADITESETVFAFGHAMGIKCLAGYISEWTRNEIYKARIGNTSSSLFTRRQGQWALVNLGVMPFPDSEAVVHDSA